jgi:branched-chain amino acid transport system ATP-binding protein
MALLEVRELTKYFGGLAAVSEVSFDATAGEILGIIGPNGAGKTTVFNLISGAHRLSSGSVIFDGEDIANRKPSAIVRKGIARTFQLATVFQHMTVLESMLVAFYLESKFKLWDAIYETHSIKKREENIKQRAYEAIAFVGLKGMENRLVGKLPHGHRKSLGLAMAMATSPKVLLLDEPVGGMNAAEVAHMITLIKELHEKGITILLVEHNLKMVMNLCGRIVVLNFGKKIAEGAPDEIRGNKDVVAAYLGSDYHVA